MLLYKNTPHYITQLIQNVTPGTEFRLKNSSYFYEFFYIEEENTITAIKLPLTEEIYSSCYSIPKTTEFTYNISTQLDLLHTSPWFVSLITDPSTILYIG